MADGPSADDTTAAIRWAMSYNGYERLASDPGALERLLQPARDEFASTGRAPSWCGVDLLRGWAFLLQRHDYFAGGGSLGAEWHTVLDAVRHHPTSTRDDLPPAPSTDRAVGAGGPDAVRVLGVDGCPRGWVGVVLAGDDVAVHVAPRIDELVDVAGRDARLDVVGIDIPIGLPDAGRREADSLARRRVGARSSSVFTTPVREALLAATHAEAVAVNRSRAGTGISIQAYALRTKVLEVDAWARRAPCPAIEVHPEVSFAEMNGASLAHAKSTRAGLDERLATLRAHGIRLGEPVRRPGAGADDVLDAAAVAWTARRRAVGDALALPDPPEVFSDGWPAAIWV
ncbi:DUF429 domain-containing protein [Cellulomonas dongxiuzhuiae]|uniref:DUF429 domain-containing protein n=1 Tax=Cellulomonas dongxiuzhuiae TaxID=2819979 RepID=UPI001AAEDEE5|nr:DUF429 domain-containing protein [Cellulomonas dongxiuzhuiae]MBO3088240.1 DUF429 domain-containing protein [Cellulomonas dongxiuzhuiae]